MFSKNELFISLTDDFAKAVTEYRKARSESEIPDPVFMSEEEEEKRDNEYMARMKSLTKSKDYINLTRVEFWGKIIESKIEVVACIGGLKLMQEFNAFLSDYEKYTELNLASAFDYFADGIGGWWR